jgi:hypothetical protein
MKRENKLLNAACLLAIFAATAYFWWRDYISMDSIIVGIVGLLVLRGQSVQGEKVDGLHWRIAELSRRLRSPAFEDNTNTKKE